MTDKAYITSRRAAELLGVSVDVVEADIQRWEPIECLIGGHAAGTFLLPADQFEDGGLERHRVRLKDMTSVPHADQG